MKYTIVCLAILLFLSGETFALQRGSGQIKSAVGSVVSSDGGNAAGEVCLNIGGKKQCFEWTKAGTKFSGFENLPTELWERSWSKGALWRITYTVNKRTGAMFLKSATFTRRFSK